VPRALLYTTKRTAAQCCTAGQLYTAAHAAIYYQAHCHMLSCTMRAHCRVYCHTQLGALLHIVARTYTDCRTLLRAQPHTVHCHIRTATYAPPHCRTLPSALPHTALPQIAAHCRAHCCSTAHCHPLPHCRTLPHCHTRTATLPHTLHTTNRTAAHCRAYYAQCVDTTVLTATYNHTLPHTAAHSQAHCHTQPRTAALPDSHTLPALRAPGACYKNEIKSNQMK
jgi:hypothetical protein